MKTNLKNYLPLLILLFAVSLSYGQSKAGGLQELVGEKGNYVENDLKKRDYYHIKTVKNGNSAYSYWWNSYKKKCVSVRVNDGRVKHILNTPSYDCNKTHNNSNNYSKYDDSYSHKQYDSYHEIQHERNYSNHVYVNDLVGKGALDAYDALENRGFREVKHFSSNGKTYRVWSNHRTNQCVKTLSQNKKITEVMRSTHCNN